MIVVLTKQLRYTLHIFLHNVTTTNELNIQAWA